jgi:small-conductance mechanosensitive channel
MQTLTEWLFGSLKDVATRLFITVIVILIATVIRALLISLLSTQKKRISLNVVIWRRNISYVSVMIAMIILFPVWLPSLQNALAVVGIFGAGVLLVLKEVILNLAGWFYIVTRRPFEEGNRVGIADHIGDVIEIRLQEFTMIEVKSREQGGQSTGRILHIPNSLLFTTALANASKEFLFNWSEMTIPLTPKSDWKRAVRIVEDVAKISLENINMTDSRIKYSEERYSIKYRNLRPGVYVEFRKGAIVLTLRYLVEPRNVRQVSDTLWREILTRFAAVKQVYLSESSDI